MNSKILSMKRISLLSFGGTIGAAILAVSYPAVAEPDPGPSPQASQNEKGVSAGGAETCCAGEQGGGRPGKFHRFHGRWEGRRNHEFGGRMLSHLLNLTDEQKAKVKEIMEASKPKIKAIREEERAKIRSVIDETRQQIRPLLTPAQQKVFDDAAQLRENARKLREESKALRQEKGEGETN
jgi:Spy/CpxP family protein refolding chaperone